MRNVKGKMNVRISYYLAHNLREREFWLKYHETIMLKRRSLEIHDETPVLTERRQSAVDGLVEMLKAAVEELKEEENNDPLRNDLLYCISSGNTFYSLILSHLERPSTRDIPAYFHITCTLQKKDREPLLKDDPLAAKIVEYFESRKNTGIAKS